MIEGMKKKSLIWGAALIAGLVSTATVDVHASFAKTSADFTDLQDLDAATKAKFDALISGGIFEGVSDSNFGVKENMNRAQFAKVAALIFGLKVDNDLKTSSFSDVKADDAANGYALPYIEALKKSGITDGVGAGEFNPAGEVTKEQLAAFLVKGQMRSIDIEASTSKSEDATVSDWAKGYVALALEKKLLNNGSDGTFDGSSKANREQLVTGVYEAKKESTENNPLEVTKAEFVEGNKLNLILTDKVDEKSIDLSKITVDGVPLDPEKDSYQLSADGKTIIVTLNEAFTFNFSKQPVIKVAGLKTPFGNELKQEENKNILVDIKASSNYAGAAVPRAAGAAGAAAGSLVTIPLGSAVAVGIFPAEPPTDPKPPVEEPTTPPTGGGSEEPIEEPTTPPTGGGSEEPIEEPTTPPTGGGSGEPIEEPTTPPTGGGSGESTEEPTTPPTGGGSTGQPYPPGGPPNDPFSNPPFIFPTPLPKAD